MGDVKFSTYKDEDGQWWIVTKAYRTRAKELPCDYPGCTGTAIKMLCRIKWTKHNYCSSACAAKANRQYLQISGKGPDAHNWKGGRKRHQGYVSLYRPDHPDADTKGYVTEHRLVMEAMIGRRLLKVENVHHKNGKRDDNRPENLELWSTTQPKGARAVDLLHWAEEIIKLYADFCR